VFSAYPLPQYAHAFGGISLVAGGARVPLLEGGGRRGKTVAASASPLHMFFSYHWCCRRHGYTSHTFTLLYLPYLRLLHAKKGLLYPRSGLEKLTLLPSRATYGATAAAGMARNAGLAVPLHLPLLTATL